MEPTVAVPGRQPALIANRPLRSIRDLADHTLLHGDDGREWNTWLAAADAADIGRGRQHFMSDARLSTEAALHGQGVALGDTITAGSLIARGELIAPFDLSVPANDAFYVACRPENRAAPIIKVFIDWLFAALAADPLPDPQASGRTVLRTRHGKMSAATAASTGEASEAPSGHPYPHPENVPSARPSPDARRKARTTRTERPEAAPLPHHRIHHGTQTMPRFNPRVATLAPPPIPSVFAWAKDYDGSRGPLIDVSQAVPGYPAHPDMLAWLGEAAASTAATGYGPIEGEPGLRAAYARHVGDLYGAAIGAEHIHITAGCNQAFIVTMMALAGAGDTVLVTNPSISITRRR